MFWHNFKYTFTSLLRDRTLLFWTFAFPIVLSGLFHLALGNLNQASQFKAFNIAIVDGPAFQENIAFKETFAHLGDSQNSSHLFNVTYTDLSHAEKLLNDQKITGFLSFKSPSEFTTELITDLDPATIKNTTTPPAKPSSPAALVQIHLKSNGVNQTILQQVVDEVVSQQSAIDQILIDYQATHPQALPADFTNLIDQVVSRIQHSDLGLQKSSQFNFDFIIIAYFSVIAMTCLYSGATALYTTNFCLPNMHHVGRRVAISPTPKSTLLLGGLLASYLVQLLGTFFLFFFLLFVLKVDFGPNLHFVVLLACIGTLAGLSFGVTIAALIKANINVKNSLIVLPTMIGCFFAGMMNADTKYFIDQNFPLLNRLNPANLITDGLYALSSFGTIERYLLDLFSLIGFILFFFLLSYRVLRRQKYDSL